MYVVHLLAAFAPLCPSDEECIGTCCGVVVAMCSPTTKSHVDRPGVNCWVMEQVVVQVLFVHVVLNISIVAMGSV